MDVSNSNFLMFIGLTCSSWPIHKLKHNSEKTYLLSWPRPLAGVAAPNHSIPSPLRTPWWLDLIPSPLWTPQSCPLVVPTSRSNPLSDFELSYLRTSRSRVLAARALSTLRISRSQIQFLTFSLALSTIESVESAGMICVVKVLCRPQISVLFLMSKCRGLLN